MVLAEDIRAGRLMFFSEDLVLDKVFLVPPGFVYARPLLCTSDSTLVAVQREPQQLPPRRYGALFAPGTLLRLRSNKNAVDTLRKLTGTDFYFARGKGYAEQPLGRSTFAASGGEHIFVGTTEDQRLDVLDSAGKEVAQIDLGIESRNATMGDLEAWVADRMRNEPFARTRKLLKRVMLEAPVRPSQARYASLMSDTRGNVWIKSFERGTPDTFRWYAYTSSATLLAIVDVPSTLRVMEIGDDYVLALDKDGATTDRVVLLRLEKSLPSGADDSTRHQR